MPCKRNRSFKSVWKKKHSENRKIENLNCVYPGLRYADEKLKFACKIFLKNVCSGTKFDLCVKKLEKNLRAIQILLGKNPVVAIKKILAI